MRRSFSKFSIGEFKQLLAGFNQVQVIAERFLVKSRLHGGWKGRCVQRPVRRNLQLAPTIVGPTVRLASARVLSQMTMIPFIKAPRLRQRLPLHEKSVSSSSSDGHSLHARCAIATPASALTA